MEPVESIKTCLTKFADFKGRALRSEFWWFYLLVTVLQFVLYHFGGMVYAPLLVAAVVVQIVLLVPSLAAGSRRLHDFGMSGWWQLLLILFPLGNIVLMTLWAQKGSEGDNKYGSPPQA